MAKATKPAVATTPQKAQPDPNLIPVSRRARGFDAGQTGRRLRSIPTTLQAINSQIRRYGRNAISRSRYLCLNNAYAASAKAEYVAALAGTGIKPATRVTNQAQKKEIQALWLQWTDEADADGITDFYGLQALIAGEMFEAGECFVRIRPRLAIDGLTVPLQLQAIPSEMLPFDHNEPAAGTRGRIECGIEFNAIGKRVAYWFLRAHPGEYGFTVSTATSEKVRVPAEEVIHLFKPFRAGQIRGVPHTLPGLVPTALIDLYDDAELERKKTAALFGAFTSDEGESAEEFNPLAGAEEFDNDTTTGVSNFALEPGVVVDLPKGRKISFAEPADVGATYEPFQYRNLTRAAAGMGATYVGMTGDLRAVNYSSDRSGLIRFRRKVEMDQHHIMIFQFCRAVWKRWWTAAILSGSFTSITAAAFTEDMPAFLSAKWIPPKWDWVDPLKDRQAEKLAVDSGFKSRSSVIEAEGFDAEEVDTEIAADQARAEQKGIKFITLAATVSPTTEDVVAKPTEGVAEPDVESEEDSEEPEEETNVSEPPANSFIGTGTEDSEFG